MIKFYYSKYKYLKHRDFILFRNFNDFLKFNPRILFLKIKTRPLKEVSRPSQKEFLLCEHLVPTTYLRAASPGTACLPAPGSKPEFLE